MLWYVILMGTLSHLLPDSKHHNAVGSNVIWSFQYLAKKIVIFEKKGFNWAIRYTFYFGNVCSLFLHCNNYIKM